MRMTAKVVQADAFRIGGHLERMLAMRKGLDDNRLVPHKSISFICMRVGPWNSILNPLIKKV